MKMMKKKENRVPLAVRIPVKIMEFIQAKTKDNDKLTQADLVEESLNRLMSGHSDEEYKVIIKNMKDKTEFVQRQLEELEKKTGKKIPKTRRISFAVTNEEFRLIESAAHKLEISKSELFRVKLFTQKNSLPLSKMPSLVVIEKVNE